MSPDDVTEILGVPLLPWQLNVFSAYLENGGYILITQPIERIARRPLTCELWSDSGPVENTQL